MALEGLKAGIFGAIGRLKGKRKLDEAEMKELSKSIRRALLEADFNVRQSKEITARLEERMIEEEPLPGINLQTHAMNIIYTELVRLLGPPREIRPHNQTILMVGLGYPGEVANGNGAKWTFWVLAMLPFIYILRTLYSELQKAGQRETGAIATQIKNATYVLLTTWMVYPIAYLFPIFDGESETLETLRQVGYTFADITAKGLYGLMILWIAKARTEAEVTA